MGKRNHRIKGGINWLYVLSMEPKRNWLECFSFHLSGDKEMLEGTNIIDTPLPPYLRRYETFVIAPVFEGSFHIYTKSRFPTWQLLTHSGSRLKVGRRTSFLLPSLLPSPGLQDDWFTHLVAPLVDGILRYIQTYSDTSLARVNCQGSAGVITRRRSGYEGFNWLGGGGRVYHHL